MRNINYSIDDYNELRVYDGNKILFQVQDVRTDEQAMMIIRDELGE